MIEIAVLSGVLDQFKVQADPRQRRLQWLLREVGSRYSAQTTSNGNDFQVRLDQPLVVCECALFIRAGLLAASPNRKERWDTAIALAVGEGDIEAVHETARRGLSALERGHLVFHADSEPVQLALSLATAFVDNIVSRWTLREAEAYFAHLQTPGGHQAIAQRLHKSRPTITKTLLRGNYNLLDRYRRDAQTLMSLNQV